jgi:hypothetical protein
MADSHNVRIKITNNLGPPPSQPLERFCCAAPHRRSQEVDQKFLRPHVTP